MSQAGLSTQPAGRETGPRPPSSSAYDRAASLKQPLAGADRGLKDVLVTMRTLFATAWPRIRRWRRIRSLRTHSMTDSVHPRERRSSIDSGSARVYARCAQESGMTLIEVLIASMIVAVVAVGTLTGIDAADHSTADTRSDAQAIQVAGQDEERLRGLTTTELEQFATTTTSRAENGACIEQVSGAWHYWNQSATAFCEKPTGLSGTTYTGTVYTVESSAEYVAAEGSKPGLTCETSGGTANYIRTTSLVTWNATGTHRASQSSIVTVPTSNTLVVKVLNQNSEAVPGATVGVTDESTKLTRTTPSTGCAVFGGLPGSTAEVTATKASWVNENTETTPPVKDVPVSKTATTEQKFVIAEPGEVTAEFIEAGGTKSVEGSTFVAFQTTIAAPDGFVGGAASSYVKTVALKDNTLFPFSKSPYSVFAGDCEANNPKVVTGSVEPTPVLVTPNGDPTAKVYLPKVSATLYEGTSKTTPKVAVATVEHAMIINAGCKSTTERTGTVPYEHEVTFSGGSLVQDYQPYADELLLCMVVHKGASYYKLEPKFANTSSAGVSLTYYLEESGVTKSASAQTCP
jgi:prepilin-type N-terminal cleavage/methylation domain-containing protein